MTLAASTASAQTIGTFRWRTAPYCSVMIVTVTRVGSFGGTLEFNPNCTGSMCGEPRPATRSAVVLERFPQSMDALKLGG